jgi:DNA-binding LacI/PurR family transcriptional regulator
MQYVEEMGYRPNLVARSLIMQQTRTIGLVVPTVSNPFYAEIIEATERITHRLGFRILVTNTQDDKALGQELLEDLYARRVDGIIIMGGSGGLPFPTIHSLVSQGLPILGCIWEEEDQHFSPAIGFDFAEGGRQVAAHLLSLGHRRIAIVAHGIEGEKLQHHLRVSGCREVLAEAGYPFDPQLLVYGDSSIQSGERAALRLFALSNPPSAIFATNDLMAIGVLSAAWKCGLHVPRDLSIVGFDDIVMASYTTPPLTTILMDRVVLMEKSVEMLLSIVEGKSLSPLPLLAPTLMIRGSTDLARRKEGK